MSDCGKIDWNHWNKSWRHIGYLASTFFFLGLLFLAYISPVNPGSADNDKKFIEGVSQIFH